MGTKNNPGRFDCYAKLDPNEPYFTLRSGDPLAPALVELWAAAFLGDYQALHRAVHELKGGLVLLETRHQDDATRAVDKATEARTCAAQMRGYAALRKHSEARTLGRAAMRPDNGCSE